MFFDLVSQLVQVDGSAGLHRCAGRPDHDQPSPGW